ncbi:magnesium transporter [Candidatus Uhrbacteria bacterium]|nr:magnesium transporter [Candidatus Uhrbacteria bacterium]
MATKKFSARDVRELVHQMQFNKKERVKRFLSLAPEIRAVLLCNLGKQTLNDIARKIKDEVIIEALNELDPDQTTDLLRQFPKLRRHRLISRLTRELKNSVELLSSFDPQTAAGLMSADYIQIETGETVQAVARKIKEHESRTGRIPTVIAMRANKIIGYIPGHALAIARPSEPIERLIRHVPSIAHDANHAEVLEVFRQHPHARVVVRGKTGNVIGVIYSDDLLSRISKHESASLYHLAGVRQEETVADSTWAKVSSRYKWLIINLATAFLASFTVSLFDETISKYVLLAVYMPIVAGMGGNAGTQTLAVLVRGITLNQIDLKTAWPTISRELLAGLINGVINGLIVAAIVILFNHDLRLALVLSIAMMTNLLVAGFFGTLVPLIMKRLGKDPASSATVFITTATDVLGFLTFLGLATILLR